MRSYIQKQTKLTKERIEAKLESSLAQTLEHYCHYLDSDRDYVISQALEIAFRKDKGFGAWLGTQQNAMPASAVDRGEETSIPSTREAGRSGPGAATDAAGRLPVTTPSVPAAK